MNDKLNRIERFIESLPNDVETPEMTSALLPTAVDLTGGYGANNDGDCTNRKPAACMGSVNAKSCKNYNGSCSSSYNGGSCFNDSSLETNTSFC